MNFIFGLAPDSQDRMGILVSVDRFSKMTHMGPVHATITAVKIAGHFVDGVFRHHRLPEILSRTVIPDLHQHLDVIVRTSVGENANINSGSFVSKWANGRVNRVLEDVLRSYATLFTSWSACLPYSELARNNAVHASTALTPFYVNLSRHPQVSTVLAVGRPTASRGFTLEGDEGDKHQSSAAHGILSADVVTRSKAKAAVFTRRCVASLLAQWTAHTLIDPS